ncbi:hypothetical protein SAY87_029863 [Trapa incisa]|uniref:Uncharacterized protein n=1 Tax=Trapa incisa TaxID=236973 RepID=A0AAN7K8E4_9MYRT|nr:hypothetical protein SAY87_029863 [Trapa incisa]
MMEVSLEMEDDLLFADLSRRISLLIMEEDDVALEEEPLDSYCHYSSLQGLYRAVNNPAVLPPISPYQQVYCRSEISKGTGVFIPKSSLPRRNKQGRFSSKASPPPPPPSSASSWSHKKFSDHQNNTHARSGASQFSSKSYILPKKL